MTNDGFLDELRADWRRQTIDLDRLKRLTERRRRLARIAMLGNCLGGGVALLFGGWFAYLAVVHGGAIHALAGVALLVAFPLIVIDNLTASRVISARHDDTPSGVLTQARHQVEASRRRLWGCRIAAIILFACALGVVALRAVGQATGADAVLLAPFWGVTALLVWIWQSWRQRRLAVEAERFNRLLAELSEAEQAVVD